VQPHSARAQPPSNMTAQVDWRRCRGRTWRKCGGVCTSASCSLGWAALLTYPHQDQISTDSCIVLLALHAGTGGVGQWKTTISDPSYLGKKAHTASADVGRAGAEFSSYTRAYPLPSGGAAAIATCTALENACCLHAFEDAEMEKGQGECGGSWCRLAASAPFPSRSEPI
jgi:hypothetical protein